jgi:multisubunit Na+/H+ antiporter MnhB subunit
LGCEELKMDTLAFWAAISANAVSAVLLMLYYRYKVRTGLVNDRRAKSLYAWWYIPIGTLAALILFYALAVSLNVPTGHGEILIAVPIFNAGLSLALLFVGRVVIAWRPLQW